MSGLETAVIALIGGVAASIFAIGAVKVGIPAARMAISSISGMLMGR